MGSNSSFYIDPNQAAVLTENANPQFTGVSLQTSAQAIPISIVWGTRRVSPNILWSSPLATGWAGVSASDSYVFDATTGAGWQYATANQGPIFGGFTYFDDVGHNFHHFGADDASNSGSFWMLPAIFGLGEGPVNSIGRVWLPGGAAPVPYGFSDPPTFQNAGNPSYFVELLTGTSTQTAWAFWAHSGGLYPGQNLTYRFTAYLATGLLNVGHDGKIPQYAYEVFRVQDVTYSQTDSYLIGTDMSPAWYIVDLLTSLQYGMGIASGDIDATSLANARQYWGAQGLFFSPLLTSQVAGTDFIDRTAQISNAWIFWSGVAFYFVPLGDEALSAGSYSYTPDTSAAYDLSNNDFIGPLQVDRADPIDCDNRVRIEISDRQNDYATSPIEWKDTTLINLYGLRDASDVAADDICDRAVGAIVVELLGKRMAYIRNTYTFTLSYRFVRILPGCILTLNDPNLGIVAVPVRVRSVEEDDKFNLKIVAEEYLGIGISRPSTTQPWTPNTGAGSGLSGGGSPVGGGALGGTVSTTGGGITLTTGSAITVLFVAGDSIVLPNPMPTAAPITLVHDLQRSGQPTPSDLEANPAYVHVSGSYTIEQAEDRSIAASTTPCALKTTGGVYTVIADGGTSVIIRAFAA